MSEMKFLSDGRRNSLALYVHGVLVYCDFDLLILILIFFRGFRVIVVFRMSDNNDASSRLPNCICL